MFVKCYQGYCHFPWLPKLICFYCSYKSANTSPVFFVSNLLFNTHLIKPFSFAGHLFKNPHQEQSRSVLKVFLRSCSLKGTRPETCKKSLYAVLVVKQKQQKQEKHSENHGFPWKWHPAVGSHTSVTNGTLLPGELCCCQENDLQRDGKNVEVLFWVCKQLTSQLFWLPSDKVSVWHDRDEPAGIDHCCRRGNPWSCTQRQLWGWCWQTPTPTKWIWEFLSTPQHMGRIILQKITV